MDSRMRGKDENGNVFTSNVVLDSRMRGKDGGGPTPVASRLRQRRGEIPLPSASPFYKGGVTGPVSSGVHWPRAERWPYASSASS